MNIRCYGSLVLCMLSCTAAFSQRNTKRTPVPLTDTVKQAVPMTIVSPKPGEPQPFAEIIPASAITRVGLFTVHQVDDRWLVEIPDSLLNRDVLIVNRIARSAADSRTPGSMHGFAGDIINENVVRFERGPRNKIFLKQISFTEYSTDTSADGLYRSVLNNTVQPISAVFDIKTLGKDSNSCVLDFTELIASDNELLFFDQRRKGELRLQQLMPDRSFIESVKTFPLNMEIVTTKTFARGAGQNGGAGPATYVLNSSLTLLPKTPMKGRIADPRVGYFTAGYTDFDADPQGVKQTEWITRFRLEPKEEDKEKYLRGELVEPAKPIIYYIDPATPKKWVPYLIKGVNDWQQAFEKAGFKNAIFAREAPTGDSTFSIDDASHNAIIYKPSVVSNATGPHVHDPRSGEIIETHINWHHNIMQLIKNLYTVQAGAIDPRTHQPQLPDDLMGRLIRFVSSHEVGHTLGLRHNYGASSTVPVDSLRNKVWVEKNGHTPSIMDYARFNYVAQPGDGITAKGIFPRIGDYDIWAIEYGYRWWPPANGSAEKQKLNQWIIEKTCENNRLWFGTETDPDDPRCQSEDLGNDAMKASAYGIKNLKRIVPSIIQWSTLNEDDYGNAVILYKEVLAQYSRYMGHVSKYIGGVQTHPRTAGEKGPVIMGTPKAKQRQAMQFLQQQLFTTPSWLMDKTLREKTGSGSMVTISRQQDPVLSRLLNPATLFKLLRWESTDPQHAYTAAAMLTDLQDGIFAELKTGKSISIFRRNLQKSYLTKLIALINIPAAPVPPPGTPQTDIDISSTDISTIAKMQLKRLQGMINSTAIADVMSRAHLQDMNDRIKKVLDPKN